MNEEEINKIIEDLKFCEGIFDYIITPEQCKLLLNYINDLQQENTQLKHRIKILKRNCNIGYVELNFYKEEYKKKKNKKGGYKK